ncbi:hypothetical protein KAU04_00860, partial [bacterium]|nr:hypothetical protein [bacterium]
CRRLIRFLPSFSLIKITITEKMEKKHGNNGTTHSQPLISTIPLQHSFQQTPGGILKLPFTRDTSTPHG